MDNTESAVSITLEESKEDDDFETKIVKNATKECANEDPKQFKYKPVLEISNAKKGFKREAYFNQAPEEALYIQEQALNLYKK